MLSVVATLYQSREYIAEFVRRTEAVVATLGVAHEIVLVNDGSPDDSLEVARAIAMDNPRVVVVDLSRNFGHHKAMMAGLMQARGERVFLIDIDLEEAPELLGEFWARMAAEAGVDVVYGQLKERKGGWFERLSGALYFSAIEWFGGIKIPRNVSTVRLMSSRYVQSLVEYREREMFMSGLWAATGFRQVGVPIAKSSKGASSYDLTRKLSLLTNSIVSFSNAPLLWIFYTGLCISLGSGAYVAWLVYIRLFRSIAPNGWTSVMASIWLLGGLIILFLGLIGIYLSKIFIEVKQRPYVSIREIIRRDGHAPGP